MRKRLPTAAGAGSLSGEPHGGQRRADLLHLRGRLAVHRDAGAGRRDPHRDGEERRAPGEAPDGGAEGGVPPGEAEGVAEGPREDEGSSAAERGAVAAGACPAPGPDPALEVRPAVQGGGREARAACAAM